MDHYRCHNAYIPKTRVERISDTVEFLPRKFRMPKMSFTDDAIHTAQYLIRALKNTAPASPLVTLGNSHKETLISLANIFEKSTLSARLPRVVQPEQHQPIREKFPITFAEPPRVPTKKKILKNTNNKSFNRCTQ